MIRQSLPNERVEGMGSCSSRAIEDGTYEPSPFSRKLAVKEVTDYKQPSFESKAAGKVLVVCTDDGRLTMANGKVFSSGNHPAELLVPLMHFAEAGFSLEFATDSGRPVVLEMWGFPTKDSAASAFYDEIKARMDAPTKLDSVPLSLDGVAGIFIPGGHGAMVNLPKSKALGELLHAAHDKSLPTVAICHGLGALESAADGVSGKPFPYTGYKGTVFSDATDKLTPKLGYLPGPMPHYVASSLEKLGMQLKQGESGNTVIDRELITGDSPAAANKLGQIAAPVLIEYAKANVLTVAGA